jgi:signal transduction histidine kinase/DNA-binding response OmpR family regulator
LQHAKGEQRLPILISLNYAFHEKNLDTSKEYGKAAVILASQLNKREQLANALTGLGIAEDYSGSYDSAMLHYLQALKIYETQNNNTGIAKVLNNIGSVYFYQKEYEKAASYWEKSLSIKETLGSKKELAAGLNNLAVVYVRLKKFEAALQYYNKIIAIHQELKDYKNLAAAFNNTGILLHKKNNNGNESIVYYNKALAIYDSINLPLGKAEVLLNLGAVSYEQKNYTQAINYFENSLAISSTIGSVAHIKQAYANLSETYELQKDFSNALKYYKRYYELKDSVMNESSKKQIAELETKYETEKKERKIELQQLAIIKSEKNFYQLAVVSAIILLLVIFSAAYFYQKKRLKEALEKAKSKFFANIVHEFRTPVTLISGPLAQAIEQSKEPEVKNMLQLAQRNAGQLVKLVNQLLDVSKLETGKMPLQRSYGNITEFIEQIVATFLPTAKSKNITLQYKSSFDNKLILFDKDAVEKIIYNLLSNAIKFTNENGTIVVEVCSPNSSELQIAVKDNGRGIAQKDLSHIFDRFYKNNEDNEQGTGIGLSLVKDLVALHNGKIDVQSERDKGTIFTISLPIENKISALQTAFVEEDDTSPIILIVEDNEDMQAYIGNILKEENYKLLFAKNGKEGLLLAQTQIPNVIVTDVMMPVADGNWLIKNLKEQVATNHIPIIMLTAKASLESRLEGLQHGVDVYLTKPFSAKEFLLQLHNIMATQQRLHSYYSKVEAVENKKEDNAIAAIKILNSTDAFVQQIIKQVTENISNENFGVEELSEKIFLSRTQVHRKLKAITGLSASQCIRNIRLEKAYELLKHNHANVTEAAYQTGFSSQSYFSKCFMEYYGFSPSNIKR